MQHFTQMTAFAVLSMTLISFLLFILVIDYYNDTLLLANTMLVPDSNPNDKIDKLQPNYQHIIDHLVIELSMRDYKKWNDDIIVDGVDFKSFSKSFMESALFNRSLYFHGDSIIFYVVWSILAVAAEAVHLNSFLYLNNSTERFPDFFKACCSAEFAATQTVDGYKGLFLDYFQHKYIFPETKHSIHSFDAIYTNLGLTHALHFYPQRDAALPELLKHTETFIDRFIDYAVNTESKCLIFRALNPIAESRYNGGYKRLSERYHEDNAVLNGNEYEQLIAGCLERLNMTENEIIHETPIYNISGGEICRKYSLSYQGSGNLNERLRKYVMWRQGQFERNQNINLKIIFLNAFALFDGHDENSPMGDGRHYTQIKTVEMYALFNVIHKWC